MSRPLDQEDRYERQSNLHKSAKITDKKKTDKENTALLHMLYNAATFSQRVEARTTSITLT